MDYRRLDDQIDSYNHPEDISDELIEEIIEEGRAEYRGAWEQYISEFYFFEYIDIKIQNA